MKYTIKRSVAFLLCTLVCLLSLTGLLASCTKTPDPLANDGISSVTLDKKGRVCVEVTLGARTLEEHQGARLRLYELLPGETFSSLSAKEPLAEEKIGANVSFRIPFEDGDRTRLYSSYAVFFDDGSAVSPAQVFLENPEQLAETSVPFAWQSSPKALVADNVEEALKLGVMHAVAEASLAELFAASSDGALSEELLVRLDGEIDEAAKAGMQVTLRLHTANGQSIHSSQHADLADRLADRYADRVSAVWLCGDSADGFAPAAAANMARMLDLAFVSRNRDARIYVEAPTQSLLDTKAYLSDLMLLIDAGGDLDWGAVLAPSTEKDLTTPDDLSELSAFVMKSSTAGHASRLAVSLPRFDATDEELQAVKLAYAYRLSLAAGAGLILYPEHFDDESGICGLMGEERLATTAFSTLDTGLDATVESLCATFLDTAWTDLKTPSQISRRHLSGIANAGTDGLSRKPLFDFANGDTLGFVGVGTMEAPITRESAAWGKQVLYSWIDPSANKSGGVRRVLDDASCLANASSLSIHLLTQAKETAECTATLTVEGMTKEGARLSYHSEVLIANGEWQTVTFQIGAFTADFDPTKRCTLTLTVTPNADAAEPYVLWIKGIDARTPDETMPANLPMLLVIGGAALTFALIFAGYAIAAKKRRR